jgi:hypothetical protein
LGNWIDGGLLFDQGELAKVVSEGELLFPVEAVLAAPVAQGTHDGSDKSIGILLQHVVLPLIAVHLCANLEESLGDLQVEPSAACRCVRREAAGQAVQGVGPAEFVWKLVAQGTQRELLFVEAVSALVVEMQVRLDADVLCRDFVLLIPTSAPLSGLLNLALHSVRMLDVRVVRRCD